jgi:hypothetical protein
VRFSCFAPSRPTASSPFEQPAAGVLAPLGSNDWRHLLTVLYWTGTGMWNMTKRLEQGKFN